MLEEGETAPTFTVPMAAPENAEARGEYTAADVEEFRLPEALDHGPVVLAFFPGVFSRTCTQELCEFRDWLLALGDLNAIAGREADDPHEAGLYGVSVDTPWAQLAFIDEYDLNYPLLSGFNTDLTADFDVRREEGLLAGIANRSVFVIAPDRTIEYAWLTRRSLTFPDTDAIRGAVEGAAE